MWFIVPLCFLVGRNSFLQSAAENTAPGKQKMLSFLPLPAVPFLVSGQWGFKCAFHAHQNCPETQFIKRPLTFPSTPSCVCGLHWVVYSLVKKIKNTPGRVSLYCPWVSFLKLLWLFSHFFLSLVWSPRALITEYHTVNGGTQHWLSYILEAIESKSRCLQGSGKEFFLPLSLFQGFGNPWHSLNLSCLLFCYFYFPWHLPSVCCVWDCGFKRIPFGGLVAHPNPVYELIWTFYRCKKLYLK